MKSLHRRFISSILLLIFCFGVFAVSSVYAVKPPTIEAIAAKSGAKNSTMNVEEYSILGISGFIAEKRFSISEKISFGAETLISGFTNKALKIANTEIIRSSSAYIQADPDLPERQSIAANHRPLDLKTLQFACLQPQIVRLE